MAEGKRRIKYVGPHQSVEVVEDDGTVHVVAQGSEKSVPTELAKGLLEQTENWQAGKGKADE